MKTTLIFLHGGPGFKDYLKPFFSSLSDKFNCIFYDQIQGPKVSIEDLLLQLDTIVNREPGKKIVLVGHSWGAVLAIEYATREPEKVFGLVLMNTGLNVKQWRDEYHQELQERGLMNATMEDIFLTPNELDLGKPFLKKTEESFSLETFEHINLSYISNYDVTVKLGTINVSILNIFGEKDIRFCTKVTKTFRQYNNRILDFEIKNAGHFPFLLEEPRKNIYKILETNFAGA